MMVEIITVKTEYQDTDLLSEQAAVDSGVESGVDNNPNESRMLHTYGYRTGPEDLSLDGQMPDGFSLSPSLSL